MDQVRALEPGGIGWRRPLLHLRLAGPDKPLTLLAEPWGGLAHVGVDLSGKELVGFQASLGILYKREVKLGPTKAEVEASLACTFTYLAGDGEPEFRVDVVLRIVGKAKILGCVEVQLSLVLAGTWQSDGSWLFTGSVTVGIRIGFFAVRVGYGFTCRIAGGDSEQEPLRFQAATAPAEPDPGLLTHDDWLAYRAAFAGA